MDFPVICLLPVRVLMKSVPLYEVYASELKQILSINDLERSLVGCNTYGVKKLHDKLLRNKLESLLVSYFKRYILKAPIRTHCLFSSLIVCKMGSICLVLKAVIDIFEVGCL